MCTKKEIAEAIKDLPYNLNVEDIIFEILEEPEVYSAFKGDLEKILYTTYVRKTIKESTLDIENGNSLTLQESQKRLEELYEDNNI